MTETRRTEPDREWWALGGMPPTPPTTATTVTINDLTYTTSDLTNNTSYYWKVVASDPNGGSAESTTWSFTVQ